MGFRSIGRYCYALFFSYLSSVKRGIYNFVWTVTLLVRTFFPPQRGLCCFPGLGTVGARGGGGRGEEALLLERQGRASQQTRSSSLPPPPSALPRPPRKPSARNTRYDRLEHRDARKVRCSTSSFQMSCKESTKLLNTSNTSRSASDHYTVVC